MSFKVTIDEKHYTIVIQKYMYPLNRISLLAMIDEQPWGALSVNLPKDKCKKHQFYAKEYSENNGWSTDILDKMVDMGIVKDTKHTTSSGFVHNIRLFEFCSGDIKKEINKM